MEKMYRITPRKEDGRWIAYSDKTPFFYFEADSMDEAKKKAEVALRLWRKARRKSLTEV